MAYSQPFLRLAVIGTLYEVESFTWTLSLRQNFPSESYPDVVPQAVIDAVTTFHTAPEVAAGNGARLTTIKLNKIGLDGRYVSDGDTVQHDFETPIPGVGTSNLPAQIANVVTLRTAAQRGRASSGRFYYPATGRVVSSDGRLSAATAAAVAVDATTLLNSLNAALPGWKVAVMSSIGTGIARDVTHCEVGRVLDTMRSRRRSLEEERAVGLPLAP